MPGAAHVPSRLSRLAGARRRLLLAGSAAVVALLLGAAAWVAGNGAARQSVPGLPPVPSAPGPLQVLRLDAVRLLVTDGQGMELVDASNSARRLAHPGGVYADALAIGSTWYLLSSDCQTKGLQVESTVDEGRTWSEPVSLGYVPCSGRARLLAVGDRAALMTRDDSATSFSLTVSEDRLHWPKTPVLSDAGAGDFAALADGSHVRVWCCSSEDGQAELGHAPSLQAQDVPAALPAGAEVLLGSVGSTADSFVVLSTVGTPYTSRNGTTWVARAAPFPRCACSQQQLDVLSNATWSARAWDGRRSHYAVTTDGGATWRRVRPPPGSDVNHPHDLVGWNARDAVVLQGRGAWITFDLGLHWRPVHA